MVRPKIVLTKEKDNKEKKEKTEAVPNDENKA